LPLARGIVRAGIGGVVGVSRRVVAVALGHGGTPAGRRKGEGKTRCVFRSSFPLSVS
jgi:hypothetical protein